MYVQTNIMCCYGDQQEQWQAFFMIAENDEVQSYIISKQQS